MHVEIREESPNYLKEYAQISTAFEATSVFDSTVQTGGLRQFGLVDRPLSVPYIKDYDAIPGNCPTDWQRRFDLGNWGVLSARVEGKSVGGAVIAFNTRGVEMLDDRDDLAVLWDLRVSPELRRRAVASALFAAVEKWAWAKGCRELKVETQDTNVAACKFYSSRGCVLAAIHRGAYPEFPDEIQLLWRKERPRDAAPAG